MEWDEVIDAASAINWVTAFATTGGDARAHVSFVAPGFGEDGHVYVATRPGSRKARNLGENSSIAMHWPVAGGGPGELFMRGTATLHDDLDTKRRIWEQGGFTWELEQFFSGGVEDPDLVFVDITPTFARILGPDGRREWSAD